MAQAKGANAYIAYCEEDTWGTTPASPTMRQLKALTYGESFGSTVEEVVSNAVNGSRVVESVRGGNIDVAGELPIELPLLGIGTLLKHAIGKAVTTGAGPYTHTLTRGPLPAGLTIEKAFPDLGRFLRFRGFRVGRLSLQVGNQGLITGSIQGTAKDETSATVSLGNPTGAQHVPFMHHEASLKEAGSEARVASFSLELTNELEAVRPAGSRVVTALNEGKGHCTGAITYLFDSDAHYQKWLTEQPTRLQLTLTSTDGSIEFDLPNVVYTGDATPKISTAQGLVVALKWRAVKDSVSGSDLIVRLVNSEATV
ncbi:phage tail tube protein [Chitiniphilus shinanonensis]|uniref:phage tail tube protein n=1 Tax=Chitiniphilus shinanonensis TaxID=553088 RepID=UPI003043E1F4